MPFLRSLDSVSSSQELRSSKTLIGSGQSTCDVVITGVNVLELHALLNLSADKASAKLVPFSTTDAGVCYVNDVVVSRNGAIVVHGDRIAFGTTRNAFLFELTPHPQMTAVTKNPVQHLDSFDATTTNANRAFRKALDALRGDRKISTPNASVIASIQSNTPAARNRTNMSFSVNSAASPLKSKDQLSKFLLEASSDSLLSDYVERKLKQRRSKTSSVASSNQSGSTRRSRSSDKLRQSREEQNKAEVEKLRLSQRIREVNDVLNGDMKFRESYLSPSAKRSKTNNSRWGDGNNHRLGSSHVLQSVENSIIDGSDNENEEDDDDDLPVMMERPASTSATRAPPNLSDTIQTEHSELEDSLHPSSRNNDEDEIGTLEFSLESLPVSDTTQLHDSKSQSYYPPKRDFASKAASLGFNDLTRSRSINTERQEAAKTAFQEKLINQMIRLKQKDIMSRAFVGWKRGRQIQSQNRRHRAQQLQEVRAALGKLRRDHFFIRWREFAAMASEVMICRLESFQQRCESRLVRKCWITFRLHHLAAVQRSKLLRGLVIRKAIVTRHTAFRKWEHFTQQYLIHSKSSEEMRAQQVNSKLGEEKRVQQGKLDVHLERMSERHYSQRIVQPLLAQILRKWKTLTCQHKKQRQMLRKVLVRSTARCAYQAWQKWNEIVLLSRQQRIMKKQSEQHIQQTTERLTKQHEQVQSSLRENHADQVQKLMIMIEESDQELEQRMRQERAESLEKVAAAKKKLEQDLHGFFESAIFKCDEQIAQANNHLQDLLQSAEDNVLAARFGAAQYLVDSMLQQKLRNANECTRLQHAHVKAPVPQSNPNDPLPALSSNGRFLYDMIQQRLTRLQQLHQSFAKLAAVSDSSDSLDPERLHHSRFLADALLQRQQRHLQSVLRLLHP